VFSNALKRFLTHDWYVRGKKAAYEGAASTSFQGANVSGANFEGLCQLSSDTLSKAHWEKERIPMGLDVCLVKKCGEDSVAIQIIRDAGR